jgi:hypothetical protein
MSERSEIAPWNRIVVKAPSDEQIAINGVASLSHLRSTSIDSSAEVLIEAALADIFGPNVAKVVVAELTSGRTERAADRE